MSAPTTTDDDDDTSNVPTLILFLISTSAYSAILSVQSMAASAHLTLAAITSLPRPPPVQVTDDDSTASISIEHISPFVSHFGSFCARATAITIKTTAHPIIRCRFLWS
jgi:hypothetical protein